MLTLISLALAIAGVGSQECDEISSSPVISGILDVPGLDDNTACWNIILSENEPYSGILVEILDLRMGSGVNLAFKGYEEYAYASEAKEPSCWFWTFNKTCLFNSKELRNRCNGHAHFISFHGPVILELHTPTKSFESWRPLFGIKYSYITAQSSLLFNCTAQSACPNLDTAPNSVMDSTASKVSNVGETQCSKLALVTFGLAIAFLFAVLVIQVAGCKINKQSSYVRVPEDVEAEPTPRDADISAEDTPSPGPDTVARATIHCHVEGEVSQSSRADVEIKNAPVVSEESTGNDEDPRQACSSEGPTIAISSASDVIAEEVVATDKPVGVNKTGAKWKAGVKDLLA